MNTLKQKLSSRKLWAAIVGVVASFVALLLGEGYLTEEMIDALNCLVTACSVYIFGEGLVDAAREKYGIDVGAIVRDMNAAESEKTAEAEEDPTAEE